SQVVLQVENMTCPACSITIEKALDKVPGVTARRVDTQAATVTVAFDAERTNAAAIAKAITDAGFPATAKAGAKSG
ncbi:MAG: heavy-metal-associated domain-containing protein, partial [Gammaproteobacteria bacterium]|nr:heavy-metal-associated domain-containing protein [Gammaproteobacteria bacterium]